MVAISYIPLIVIEWKIIYIGSASDEKYDQVLDTVEVGPLACGTMKFTFEVQSPVSLRL